MELSISERVALSISLEEMIQKFEKNAEISKSANLEGQDYWSERAEFYKSINTKLGFGEL